MANLVLDGAYFTSLLCDEIVAVTDPDTGLTFGYLRYTETRSNRIFVTVECLYGFKKAIGNGLKRIVKP